MEAVATPIQAVLRDVRETNRQLELCCFKIAFNQDIIQVGLVWWASFSWLYQGNKEVGQLLDLYKGISEQKVQAWVESQPKEKGETNIWAIWDGGRGLTLSPAVHLTPTNT